MKFTRRRRRAEDAERPREHFEWDDDLLSLAPGYGAASACSDVGDSVPINGKQRRESWAMSARSA
jgi:hypothetical protein